MRTWQASSDSDPVDGIQEAITQFWAVDKKVSVYVFGDDFQGNYTIDSVVATIDRLNRVGADESVAFLSELVESGGSDADYLRLRNVQLGYTFRNIGQGNTNLRLYVSGANLLTFTDFAGLDPEASGQDVNGFRQGEIFFSRPQTRILSFGFNLNL